MVKNGYLLPLCQKWNALNIEAFELLKLETIIPDNTANLLEKYTADIYRVFGDSIENILKDYLRQINNKLK